LIEKEKKKETKKKPKCHARTTTTTNQILRTVRDEFAAGSASCLLPAALRFLVHHVGRLWAHKNTKYINKSNYSE